MHVPTLTADLECHTSLPSQPGCFPPNLCTTSRFGVPWECISRALYRASKPWCIRRQQCHPSVWSVTTFGPLQIRHKMGTSEGMCFQAPWENTCVAGSVKGSRRDGGQVKGTWALASQLRSCLSLSKDPLTGALGSLRCACEVVVWSSPKEVRPFLSSSLTSLT